MRGEENDNIVSSPKRGGLEEKTEFFSEGGEESYVIRGSQFLLFLH